MTRRVQIRRVVVDGEIRARVPKGAVYIAQAKYGLRRSEWVNPYWSGPLPEQRREAVERYRRHLRKNAELRVAIRARLAGRDIACWCKDDVECHGDVILRVAAGGEP